MINKQTKKHKKKDKKKGSKKKGNKKNKNQAIERNTAPLPQ